MERSRLRSDEGETMKRSRRNRATGGQRGFTLVEVLVASVLFAIGMMAAMAMQYTALGGFSNSRDTTNAAKVGNRVVNLLKAESQQWRDGNSPSPNSIYNDDADGDDAGETNTSFNDPVLGNLTWDWSRVFDRPVDVRLTDAGPRRYCAYVRGGAMSNADGIIQVQVAVVYPGSTSGYSSGSCDQNAITNNLNPASSPPDLEVNTDFRAVYSGGIIIKRSHLDFWGSA